MAISVEEFRWNLKRLLREGYPEGIPLHDLSGLYKHWQKVSIEPTNILAGSTAWENVFTIPTLKQSFNVSKKDNLWHVKIRSGNETAVEELSDVLALASYANYVMMKAIRDSSVQNVAAAAAGSLPPPVPPIVDHDDIPVPSPDSTSRQNVNANSSATSTATTVLSISTPTIAHTSAEERHGTPTPTPKTQRKSAIRHIRTKQLSVMLEKMDGSKLVVKKSPSTTPARFTRSTSSFSQTSQQSSSSETSSQSANNPQNEDGESNTSSTPASIPIPQDNSPMTQAGVPVSPLAKTEINVRKSKTKRVPIFVDISQDSDDDCGVPNNDEDMVAPIVAAGTDEDGITNNNDLTNQESSEGLSQTDAGRTAAGVPNETLATDSTANEITKIKLEPILNENGNENPSMRPILFMVEPVSVKQEQDDLPTENLVDPLSLAGPSDTGGTSLIVPEKFPTIILNAAVGPDVKPIIHATPMDKNESTNATNESTGPLLRETDAVGSEEYVGQYNQSEDSASNHGAEPMPSTSRRSSLRPRNQQEKRPNEDEMDPNHAKKPRCSDSAGHMEVLAEADFQAMEAELMENLGEGITDDEYEVLVNAITKSVSALDQQLLKSTVDNSMDPITDWYAVPVPDTRGDPSRERRGLYRSTGSGTSMLDPQRNWVRCTRETFWLPPKTLVYGNFEVKIERGGFTFDVIDCACLMGRDVSQMCFEERRSLFDIFVKSKLNTGKGHMRIRTKPVTWMNQMDEKIFKKLIDYRYEETKELIRCLVDPDNKREANPVGGILFLQTIYKKSPTNFTFTLDNRYFWLFDTELSLCRENILYGEDYDPTVCLWYFLHKISGLGSSTSAFASSARRNLANPEN